jgi:hypothetical protein
MYWWSVSKLALDFREGRVEEKDRFKYYLAMMVAWALSAQPFLHYGSVFKIADVVWAAITIVTTISGIILCYTANRSGDNKDFVGRMVCLGWPITVKVLVLAIVTSLVAFFGTDVVGKAMGSTSDQIDTAHVVFIVVWPVVLTILYYWLLYKYVSQVAQLKEALRSPI